LFYDEIQMYLIAFFGMLMVSLSIIMLVNPTYWSEGIISFSKKPYFHLFEILSRLLFGIVFILFSDQTNYPVIMLVIGYLLVIVSAGLSLTPVSKHKQFAVWSAQRFIKVFRPAGLVSLLFGLFLVYAALSN